MLLRRLSEGRRHRQLAHDLYVAIITQSRLPAFYLGLGVPDTLDGRFDLIVLHAHLVMRALGRVEGTAREAAKEVSQALFDLMFADMEQNLRELGVSDMAVGKRVKQMAQAFYGRVAAYDQGLAGADDILHQALARNLYGVVEGGANPVHLAAMAAYARRQDQAVAAAAAAMLDGRIDFVAPDEAGNAD